MSLMSELKGHEAEFELGRQVTPPPAWALENRPPLELLTSRPGHLRLALTGGIASGKSTVARMFAKLGAKEIDFDGLAHKAMEPGSPAFEKAPEIFGPEAIEPDGRLNRQFLGRAIFNDAALKEAWEALIHPATWRLMGKELLTLAGERAIVISVPLLFEAGLETFFSPLCLVFASPAIQLERLVKRNPELGEEQALKVMAAQWPLSAKLRAAQHIINNNGSVDETFRQVCDLWGPLA